MALRVLIMGLSGAGKTSLATILVEQLRKEFRVNWLNADAIRKLCNDWDFSDEGRIRQATRMREYADASNDITICDFIAALPEQRKIFAPDILVWIDTVEKCQYEDTNQAFVPPSYYDVYATSQHWEKWSDQIIKLIKRKL
jgi:adenylylsulfate kinase